VNPRREFEIIAYIAAASRVLKGYNNPLSEECLKIAEELWHSENPEKTETLNNSILASIELFITTGKDEYKKYIVSKEDSIKSRISLLGWSIGRILPKINDARFSATIHDAVAVFAKQLDSEKLQNPFGIPYKPWIWGAGWSIQKYGVSQYFLNKSFPDIVDKESALDALNFVLGCHPGENTASFASGIGARSMTIAYGYNRADWSYIPGGVVSGTALIQPDFPELKDFPYLWQQVEYVMGGGSTNFMFLVLAADQLLNK
jgi:hypothetical protein